MLLPQNISPDDCVYLNAAYVLQVLLRSRSLPMEDLFNQVRAQRKMTFAMFIHCLDWLFLINAINVSEERISLCS